MIPDGESVVALVVDELVFGRRDAVGVAEPEVASGLHDRRVRPAQRQQILQQVIRLET